MPTQEDSTWFRLYIATPPVGERLLKQFRNRFRLPYNDFISLCNDLLRNELFNRWSYGDASGIKSCDIRLLLLGTLRYLGHPGTWNDKSLILFDDLIKNIHEGKLLADKEFELLKLDKEGNVVENTYIGVWFLVDNGYLDWSTTVPPMKNSLTFEEIRFLNG